MQFRGSNVVQSLPQIWQETEPFNNGKVRMRQVRLSQFLNFLETFSREDEERGKQQISQNQGASGLKQSLLPRIAKSDHKNSVPQQSISVCLEQLQNSTKEFQEKPQERKKIQRHVGFRNSIRIIDYTNKIITRDSINGELNSIGKIRRRIIKTEADY